MPLRIVPKHLAVQEDGGQFHRLFSHAARFMHQGESFGQMERNSGWPARKSGRQSDTSHQLRNGDPESFRQNVQHWQADMLFPAFELGDVAAVDSK